MKDMTDYDAFYGEFRAVSCEWIGEEDERCRMPNIFGKSYCKHHYHRVFRTTSDEEYEKEVEVNIKESCELGKQLINKELIHD